MFIEECVLFRARVGIHDKALKSSGSEGFPVLGLLTASWQFPALMLGVLSLFLDIILFDWYADQVLVALAEGSRIC